MMADSDTKSNVSMQEKSKLAVIISTYRLDIFICVMLMALCFVCYANTLENEFVQDDKFAITGNERVTGGQYKQLLTGSYWDEDTDDKLWRPITSISYALNWSISQKPSSFRIVNIFLHALCTVGVYWLTTLMFRSRVVSVVAALIFAIHPIHSEPLNTIVGRADILSCLFILLGLIISRYIGHDSLAEVIPDLSIKEKKNRLAKKFDKQARGLVFICFLLSMLSKESGITFLGLLVLSDWQRYTRIPKSLRNAWCSNKLWDYSGIILCVGIYLMMRLFVLGQLTSSGDIPRGLNPINTPESMLASDESAFLVRWGTPFAVIWKSFSLLVWPWTLCYDYSYSKMPEVRQWSDHRLWYGLIVSVSLVAVSVVSYLRKQKMIVAVLLAVFQFAIVSNIVVIIGTIFGERLLYAPSVGFCMAAGLLSGSLYSLLQNKNLSQKAIVGIFSVALASVGGIFVYLNVIRAQDWRDPKTLLFSEPSEPPVSYKVLYGQAESMTREKKFSQAIKLAERSIELVPELWQPYDRLGEAHVQLWDTTRNNEYLLLADKHFQTAMEKGGEKSLRVIERFAFIKSNLKQFDRAIELQEMLVDVSPDYARGHANLAYYMRLNNPGDEEKKVIIEVAEKAVSLDPNDPLCHVELIKAYDLSNDNSKKRDALQNAMKKFPPGSKQRQYIESMLRVQ